MKQILGIIQKSTLTCALFCYSDEENGHCACTSGHLTTANQSEIRKAYLVSVEQDRQALSCLYEIVFAGRKNMEYDGV